MPRSPFASGRMRVRTRPSAYAEIDEVEEPQQNNEDRTKDDDANLALQQHYQEELEKDYQNQLDQYVLLQSCRD